MVFQHIEAKIKKKKKTTTKVVGTRNLLMLESWVGRLAWGLLLLLQALKMISLFFFSHVAYDVLVPQPGIKPLAVAWWRLKHWTTEVVLYFLMHVHNFKNWNFLK